MWEEKERPSGLGYMAGMIGFLLMILATKYFTDKHQRSLEVKSTEEYRIALSDARRNDRRYGAIMSRLTTYSAEYITKHSPPAMNTLIGVALAKQFVSNMKTDLRIKENYEVIGILRAWNKIYGSPFSEAELKEFSLTEPVKKQPRPKRGSIASDQTHLPFEE